MKYLVDTNAWIGFLAGDARFGKQAREVMAEEPLECRVSIASVWEAAIKVGNGKLVLPYDLRNDLPRIFEENGFQLVGMSFDDAVSVRDLEKLHGDPFDRIQVVQARARGLRVVSRDPVFEDYGLTRVW